MTPYKNGYIFKSYICTFDCREVSKKMAQHWVNFAKYGNPSIAGLRWVPVTKESSSYMEINERNAMKTYNEDELGKFQMWKNIFEKRAVLDPKTTPVEVKLKPNPAIHIQSYTQEYKNLINFA